VPYIAVASPFGLKSIQARRGGHPVIHFSEISRVRSDAYFRRKCVSSPRRKRLTSSSRHPDQFLHTPDVDDEAGSKGTFADQDRMD
jgi:hypothetical protein